MREREMAAQQANQNAILMALVGRQTQPDGRVGVPASLEDLINPTRGKFGIANRINPQADKESGATIPAQYGLFGDLSNVDISSAKNKIKSGENGGATTPYCLKKHGRTSSSTGSCWGRSSIMKWTSANFPSVSSRRSSVTCLPPSAGPRFTT